MAVPARRGGCCWNTAIGFIADPAPFGTAWGDAVKRNSQRPTREPQLAGIMPSRHLRMVPTHDSAEPLLWLHSRIPTPDTLNVMTDTEP